MDESYDYAAFLPRNKVLVTKFVAVTNRLSVNVVEDIQIDRVGNWFVMFQDPFAHYFEGGVVILNGIPPQELYASFRKIVGDVVDAGGHRTMRLWVITGSN